MAKRRREKGGSGLLFWGSVLILFGSAEESQPATQAPTPQPTPSKPPTTPPAPTPPAQQKPFAYYAYLNRTLTQTCAPGLFYLRKNFGTSQKEVARFPCCTGRNAQLTTPRNQDRQDFNAPLTVFGQPKRYVYQVTGPMVLKPVSQNPAVVKDPAITFNLGAYSLWQAPIRLVDLQTMDFVWTGDESFVVIDDGNGERVATANNLPYPLIPNAITLRTAGQQPEKVAQLFNAALTHNQNMGKIFGIEMSG